MIILKTYSPELNSPHIIKSIRSISVKNSLLTRGKSVIDSQVTSLLSKSSYELLDQISKNVLIKDNNQYKGFDKLSIFFESTSSNTGLWVLEYLEKDKYGPVSKEEFDFFMTPKRKEHILTFWGPVLSHDLNNTIAPLSLATQHLYDKTITISTKEKARELNTQVNNLLSDIKNTIYGKISIGQFLVSLENYSSSIKDYIEQNPSLKNLLSDKINRIISVTIQKLHTFSTIYRQYLPENIMVFSSGLSFNCLVPAFDFLVNKREKPVDALVLMTSLWLKRREIEGGSIYDKNFGLFLKLLKNNPASIDIYKDAIEKINSQFGVKDLLESLENN